MLNLLPDAAGARKSVEVDGVAYTMPVGVNPLAWAQGVEEAATNAEDADLSLYAYKIAAHLLAASAQG